MNQIFEIGHLKEHEISALLDLQWQNMRLNLDAETIDSQGFVSFRYTPEILRAKMQDEPQIVARADGQIVGYALVTTVKVGRSIPSMIPLLDNLLQLNWQGKPLSQQSYYIMGQVCVRAGYRGIGIFDALYAGHRQTFSNKYACVITEIATDNRRSLAAHRRLGFETIDIGFDDFNKKEWHIVAWDWQ